MLNHTAGLRLPTHPLLLSALTLGESVTSSGKSREKVDKQGTGRTMSFHWSLTSPLTYSATSSQSVNIWSSRIPQKTMWALHKYSESKNYAVEKKNFQAEPF